MPLISLSVFVLLTSPMIISKDRRIVCRDEAVRSVICREPLRYRQEKPTPFVYRARVVAFIRPDNIVAEAKADTPEAALKGALDSVIRQIREQREKLRERWKQL